jgi:hypothetical protein
MTLRYDSRSRVSTYTQSWVSNVDPDFGVYESIATSVSTYGVAFTSIPTQFKHLQLRVLARDSSASQNQELAIRLNGDATSNYKNHWINGNGSSATSSSDTRTYMHCAVITSAFHSASIEACAIIDILDWQSTNKVKVVRSLGGYDANGSGQIELSSAMWIGSASTAITQIEVFVGSGVAVANNHFALYGIKA